MTNLSEVMPSLPPVGTPRFGILVLHWKPTAKKNRPTNREHRWYLPDKSWGDDCSWVDFGYVFAMLQRLLHFQQWKRPWPEVLLAVWRWENHTTCRLCWTVGWCITGFYVDIFCPWTIHETCNLSHWKEGDFFWHLCICRFRIGHWNLEEWTSRNAYPYSWYKKNLINIWLKRIDIQVHVECLVFFRSTQEPLLRRGPIMRGSFITINLADPSLFPTWKYCSAWNYREERCDLK